MPPADPLERFTMMVSPELLGRIDEWRRAQRDIPNRSEAVRRMIETVLTMGQASADKAGEN